MKLTEEQQNKRSAILSYLRSIKSCNNIIEHFNIQDNRAIVEKYLKESANYIEKVTDILLDK